MAIAKDRPTREQALAFVEALTGWTEFFEGHDMGEPKSQHASTHLAAVLGSGCVPNVYVIGQSYAPVPPFGADNAAKRDGLLDYLQGCVDALRPEGYGTCRTCGNAYPDLKVCIPLEKDFSQTVCLDRLPPDFGCRWWYATKGGGTP
jgi:hypothetical protein